MPNQFGFLTVFLLVVALLTCACQPSSPAKPLFPLITMIPIVKQGGSGVLMMGSSTEELKRQSSQGKDQDYYTDDEQPLHQVTLTVPYAISKYEITNEQFCVVMNWAIERGYATLSVTQLTDASGQSIFLGLDGEAAQGKAQNGIAIDGKRLKPIEPRKDHPVHTVSWYGAAAFSNFLSEMNGLEPVYDLATWSWDTAKTGFRLPTEAEWEYAARGTTRRTYAWGDEISNLYVSYGSTRPVGFFDGATKEGIATRDNSSPFGIYDMTGNVWEWTWDWYGRSYYDQSPTIDPLGPSHGDDRKPYDVNVPTKGWRGGGWLAPIGWGYLRIAKRWSCAPDEYYSEVGFRIAQTQR